VCDKNGCFSLINSCIITVWIWI